MVTDWTVVRDCYISEANQVPSDGVFRQLRGGEH